MYIYSISLISGISYLSRAQEEEACQKLNVLHHDAISSNSNTFEAGEDVPLKSTADLLFTERMKIRFSEWRDAISSNSRVDSKLLGSNKFGTDQFQTVFFKMRPAIMLNGFTSHQIKLIQQVLPDIPLPQNIVAAGQLIRVYLMCTVSYIFWLYGIYLQK